MEKYFFFVQRGVFIYLFILVKKRGGFIYLFILVKKEVAFFLVDIRRMSKELKLIKVTHRLYYISPPRRKTSKRKFERSLNWRTWSSKLKSQVRFFKFNLKILSQTQFMKLKSKLGQLDSLFILFLFLFCRTWNWN